MRRLRDEVRNIDPKTLVRLCHELPAKMNEIYRLKGKKFLQTSILETLHLLAIIARSFPPKTCSGSLQTQFQQPSNQQVLVNTAVVVAQR